MTAFDPAKDIDLDALVMELLNSPSVPAMVEKFEAALGLCVLRLKLADPNSPDEVLKARMLAFGQSIKDRVGQFSPSGTA